jgi:acyl carrier protein
VDNSTFEADVIALVSSVAPDRQATVTADTTLGDDLGYDSARRLELTPVLERYFDCVLADDEANHAAATVGDVIELVRAAVEKSMA